MTHPKRAAVIAALVLVAARLQTNATAPDTLPLTTFKFTTTGPSEVVATISATCETCAWDVDGREAVTLTIALDGRYVSHLPLVRSGSADYQVLLGSVSSGSHAVSATVDLDATARDLRRSGMVTIDGIEVRSTLPTDPQHLAIALAPILYARPNTVGRFTDVPLFMWYEREPTSRGLRYRYSVIFTNEDGGTPTDRLMATWGRTTDIEYVYSVEVDATGKVLEEDLQGPEHKILPFTGKRDARHPLLWVSTDNNMVRDTGTTAIRYALAPIAFDLDGVSREAVMDVNPWLYDVASRELVREKKIVEGAPPRKSIIPDSRHFVYVEACGEVGTAALSFDVLVRNRWLPSDRGVPEYKIVRDGCFRGAVPVPPSTTAGDVRALRFIASGRPASNGTAASPASPIRIDRVNKVFMLDERYTPERSVLEWKGPATASPGAPAEIRIR
jgi:hypothetical protein